MVMTVDQFITKYVETKDDGHDFMPAEIKYEELKTATKVNIFEWISKAIRFAIDNKIDGYRSSYEQGVAEQLIDEAIEDLLFFNANCFLVLEAAYRYIYDIDETIQNH